MVGLFLIVLGDSLNEEPTAPHVVGAQSHDNPRRRGEVVNIGYRDERRKYPT